MANKMVAKRAYPVEEIMEMLVIGKNTAYSLIKTGAFKSVKSATQVRGSVVPYFPGILKKGDEPV